MCCCVIYAQHRAKLLTSFNYVDGVSERGSSIVVKVMRLGWRSAFAVLQPEKQIGWEPNQVNNREEEEEEEEAGKLNPTFE